MAINLEKEVKQLMKSGIYHPDKLFDILYHRHAVHYNKVREAIHNAKQY